mmetsp:Transcript_1443/g.1438  ORF Transcript_1443/g.1438 Transcript_1443/m.1438 type:complete len:160 (-) Transcript_1443:94-573(-)
MSITPVLAIGLLSQSIFFGGNVVISSIFIPNIRKKDIPPKLQLKLWERMYDDGSKLMPAVAITSFLCYMYEAYSSNPGSVARQSSVISGVLSIAILPFTVGAMFSTIKKLKGFLSLESDQELTQKNFGDWIDHWNKLSMVRVLIFSAGFANTLFYHIRN